MNLLKGKVTREGGKSTYRSEGVEMDLKENVPQGSAVLGIRSSKIRLATSSETGRVDAEVYSCGKHGMNTVVAMKVGDSLFKTEFKGHRNFEIGQKISVCFDLSLACVFDENGTLIQVLGEKNG